MQLPFRRFGIDYVKVSSGGFSISYNPGDKIINSNCKKTFIQSLNVNCAAVWSRKSNQKRVVGNIGTDIFQ